MVVQVVHVSPITLTYMMIWRAHLSPITLTYMMIWFCRFGFQSFGSSKKGRPPVQVFDECWPHGRAQK